MFQTSRRKTQKNMYINGFETRVGKDGICYVHQYGKQMNGIFVSFEDALSYIIIKLWNLKTA